MDKLYSIHLADSINLKQLKPIITELNIVSESTVELFYKDGNKYMSIYHFGAVSFVNFSDSEKDKLIEVIESKCQNIEKEDVIENIEIDFVNTLDKPFFKNNLLTLPSSLKNNDTIYKIVMFDISQSVALDYYLKIGESLLGQINKFAKELETTGDLGMSKKEIMKFIGKSLITKNNIVDTLYIFDSPDITWEDESVDKLHKFLVGVFDIDSRYREIENIFKVVDDNLDTFSDIYQHKSAHKMELIVIILIAIEILQAFGLTDHITKLFK